MSKTRTILGHNIGFTRRRYGQGGLNPVTYTWAFMLLNGSYVDLVTDPWPCINPPTEGLKKAVSDTLTYYNDEFGQPKPLDAAGMPIAGGLSVAE